MTVIGSSLEQQSEAMKSVGKTDAAENLAECWKTVEIMAGKRQGDGPKVSNRIKFMLQDLLETKAKGKILHRSCMHLLLMHIFSNLASVHVVFRLGNKAERRNSQNNSSNP